MPGAWGLLLSDEKDRECFLCSCRCVGLGTSGYLSFSGKLSSPLLWACRMNTLSFRQRIKKKKEKGNRGWSYGDEDRR